MAFLVNARNVGCCDVMVMASDEDDSKRGKLT